MIVIITFLLAVFLLLFRKLKLKHYWLFAIAVTILIAICFNAVLSKNTDGYEGDLVPIKSEINNIAGYEKAVKLIVDNINRLDNEQQPAAEMYEKTGHSPPSYLRDSLYKVLQNRKLRFYNYTLKIEGKDTTITFEGSNVDFYMRGSNRNSDAGYTIFWHSITYTTKPTKEFQNINNNDDTPSAVIKIKPKFYYNIRSLPEY
ncbi:MAG: hypothetical protein JST87_10245 [Bacteroidetes bacterium]|nr:hypothetical protein [Bacteroidota bacterium]